MLIDRLIDLALEEDIGPGDITTDYLIDPTLIGNGYIKAKETLVLAGLEIAKQIFTRLDPQVQIKCSHMDGDEIQYGEKFIHLHGRLSSMLKAERTALNFLQRLSGIATHVRSYVRQIKNHRIRLVDTRKTTPGLRTLEKYAVRIGGAYNHRMGLYDGVLIKDNHIAACGGIKKAVEKIRSNVSHLTKIEVEVSNMDEIKDALDVNADVIMLDNMNIDQIKSALDLIDGKALVEVSGGVSKDQLQLLSTVKIDIISIGALTHSAKAVDISMKIFTNTSAHDTHS